MIDFGLHYHTAAQLQYKLLLMCEAGRCQALYNVCKSRSNRV